MPKFDRNNQEYAEWVKRAIARLAELEARITAISKKSYPGCGFHYDKVNEVKFLHKVLVEPVVIDPTAETNEVHNMLAKQIIWQVRFEELERDVAKAEKYKQGDDWQAELEKQDAKRAKWRRKNGIK